MENKVTKTFQEFIKDLEQLKSGELVRQGPLMVNDEKTLGYLMEFLLSDQSSEEQAILERFYQQLHRCFLTGDDNLVKFVNQFTFCLIWKHFSDLSRSRQFGTPVRPGLDALLIALYNLLIVDNENQPKIQTVRIPSLAIPSIYHDPAEFTVQIIRDTTRSQGASEQERRVIIGGYPPIDRLTRMKKWTVFRVLLKNARVDLPYHSKACQKSCLLLCRMLFSPSDPNAVRQDIELINKKDVKLQDKLQDRLHLRNFASSKDRPASRAVSQPRLIMNESFLLDMLDILYIVAYQGFLDECIAIVNDILEEGQFRLLASVVLLGSAVKNRLQASKNDPDEIDEIPPVAPDLSKEETRKISTASMRDKRRKSVVAKTENGRMEVDAAETSARSASPMEEGDKPVNQSKSSEMFMDIYESSPQSARSTMSESIV